MKNYNARGTDGCGQVFNSVALLNIFSVVAFLIICVLSQSQKVYDKTSHNKISHHLWFFEKERV